MSALDPALSLVLRGALALLFAAAAFHKLRAPAAFRATLADYRLLPAGAVAPVAALLALGETALSLGLLLPASAAPACQAAAGVLAAYGGAIGVNLLRGRRHVACGCLGPAAEQPLHAGLVLRNAALAGLAVLASLPVAARPVAAVDVLSIVGGVAVLAFLYLAVDGLLATRRLQEARS